MEKKEYQKPCMRIVEISQRNMLAQSPNNQPNKYNGVFSKADEINIGYSSYGSA